MDYKYYLEDGTPINLSELEIIIKMVDDIYAVRIEYDGTPGYFLSSKEDDFNFRRVKKDRVPNLVLMADLLYR